MKRTLQGHHVPVSTVVEKVQAFVPAPLPPSPPIEWASELRFVVLEITISNLN
jgi:cell filamentation protein, protein adenylyltransferase